MKKVKPAARDDLRPEYSRSDFGPLARGKYAERLKASSNIVVLTPEVAAAFPNDAAVNEALLSLIKLAQATTGATTGLTTRSSRRASPAADGRR